MFLKTVSFHQNFVKIDINFKNIKLESFIHCHFYYSKN